MIKEERMMELIENDDLVAQESLLAIYNNQDWKEARDGVSKERNGIGFNRVDADFLTSISKFILYQGEATPKQIFHIRKRLKKYHKQLMNILNREYESYKDKIEYWKINGIKDKEYGDIMETTRMLYVFLEEVIPEDKMCI